MNLNGCETFTNFQMINVMFHFLVARNAKDIHGECQHYEFRDYIDHASWDGRTQTTWKWQGKYNVVTI